MDKNFYKIAFFVSIAFVALLSSLYSFSLGKAKPSQPVLPQSTPTVSVIQPSATPQTPARLPLVAYVKNSNVFVLDPNNNSTKQITKNGDIESVVWSRDGQWLYWNAVYGDKDKKITFGRAQYPNFNLEIFLDLDPALYDNYSTSVSYYPLIKTNELLINSLKGLYILGNFSSRKALTTKQLIASKPTFPDNTTGPDVRERFSIISTTRDEKYAFINHSDGWELMIDVGFIDLQSATHPYVTFEDPQNNHYTGHIQLSPDEKYAVVSGGSSEMTGEDTKEIVFSFPQAKPIMRLSDIISDNIGYAEFIDNTKLIVSIGYDYMYSYPDYPKRFGLAAIDISTNKEIAYLPIELQESTVKNMQTQDFVADGIGVSLVKPNNIIVTRHNYKTQQLETLGYSFKNDTFKNITPIFTYPLDSIWSSIQPQ